MLRVIRLQRKPGFVLFGCSLCIAIALSLAPRLEHFRELRRNPSQYFSRGVPTATPDSYLWFRLAREYRQGDFDFQQPDVLRRYPDGARYERVPAMSWVIAVVSRATGGDVYRAGLWVTLVLSSAFAIPLAFFGLRLGHPVVGVVAALVGSWSPAYLYRTWVHLVDTDGGNLFFVWLVSTSIAWIGPRFSRNHNTVLAGVAGLSLAGFCWWYEQRAFWLLYVATFALYLAVSKIRRRRAAALLAVFVLFANPLNSIGAVENLRHLASAYVFTSQTVARGEVAGLTLSFPNINAEIQELKRIPPSQALHGIVRQPAVAAAGLIGFLVLAAGRWRIAIAVLPVLALGWLGLFRALRFTMYLAPLAGIGLGFLVALAIEVATNRLRPRGTRAESHANRPSVSGELLVYALGFAVFALTAQTNHFERSREPTIPVGLIHQLQKLREELPADAVVWSTWTYGYLIADVAGVATFDDGGDPDSVIDQLMSRAITSRNPRELIEITSFIANHGRAGIQQVLRRSADYPALLNLIGAAQRPVDRPVYVLFVQQMLKEFPDRFSKGRWDFVRLTGGAQDGYDIRICRPIDEAREVLRCSAEGKADLSFDWIRGLVDGHPQLTRSLEILGGSVRSEREFRADAPLVAQILGYQPGGIVVQFVSVDVFESVFNQMYVLGRFDRELFSEVYAHYPAARVFRVIAPESEPPQARPVVPGA